MDEAAWRYFAGRVRNNRVQLEQSDEVRDGFWKQIAGGVACVYMSKLNVKTFSAGGAV